MAVSGGSIMKGLSQLSINTYFYRIDLLNFMKFFHCVERPDGDCDQNTQRQYKRGYFIYFQSLYINVCTYTKARAYTQTYIHTHTRNVFHTLYFHLPDALTSIKLVLKKPARCAGTSFTDSLLIIVLVRCLSINYYSLIERRQAGEKNPEFNIHRGGLRILFFRSR